jgi:MerR family transcriptional regulator/heat shock protein HspR
MAGMERQSEPIGYYQLDIAAKLTGLSTRRIRAYVKQGFVTPADVTGRQVLFGDAELKQLRRIRRLADDLGINTAGIEVVLRLLDELERLQTTRASQRRDNLVLVASSGSERGGNSWRRT